VAGRVSEAENKHITLTFTQTELDAIISDMKTDTARGPDGFPVLFFKCCWPLVKHGVLHILNYFVLGRIELSQLNLGILSLIPKFTGADQIWKYRPIALINLYLKSSPKLTPLGWTPLPTGLSARIKQPLSRVDIS
jgi:hypothetical protein